MKNKFIKYLRLTFSYLFLILFCAISIYPVLQVVNISLRPANRLLTTSLEIFPQNATFENYIKLFTEQPFLIWIGNSSFISLVVTLTGVVLASTAGYAFSRYEFIGKKYLC